MASISHTDVGTLRVAVEKLRGQGDKSTAQAVAAIADKLAQVAT